MKAASFFLPLALLASAATAQSDYEPYSNKEVRSLMRDYAGCVVKRQPRKASEAVLADADSGTILRNYGMLMIGECLVRQTHTNSQMRFKGDIYRYALAEALFTREFANQPAPVLETVPRLSHRDAGAEPQPVDAKGKKLSERRYKEAMDDFHERAAFSFLSLYGECVVRLAPADSKAVLLTQPDSVEETSRFTALHQALATCMPEDRTFRFGRVALRGSIAVNYYRLAHAAQASAAGTAG